VKSDKGPSGMDISPSWTGHLPYVVDLLFAYLDNATKAK